MRENKLKATNRLFVSQNNNSSIDGKVRQGTGKGFPSPKLADAH